MAYDEEVEKHKVIHYEDYIALSEEERLGDTIYFIDDIISDNDLITQLINKIDDVTEKLKEKELI